ncbi:phage antirepressor N-terminal domain-containing protein [Aliarcobacter butzleri]|uniref:phage antirepressor N-terminal domain-containing protein n=1 Tax=Aliarcobacter butzleri TaxID=28197 RepID=UPI001EDB766D|nr:phage antirepressor N-terminal domain-containing protein [Aliarcobacter butzleri]MCG3706420.1 phage antirepressor N-terminal domain-containing protein [Aliarcobacter butzleri]
MELIKVDFKNDKLDIIEETQSIVVKDICEHIGLRFRTQYEKIKADESFESKLIKVQTRGGLQEVFTIPLSKLNGWLFNINPNKVKPEVKQKLIEYKKECFNVLNNYFNQGIAVNHRASDTDLQKILDTLEKQNQEIQNLKNQLILKEDENPFKGFYGPNWAFRKRENEYAYSRKDWMLLLNECERTLVAERQNRKYKQLLISGASK